MKEPKGKKGSKNAPRPETTPPEASENGTRPAARKRAATKKTTAAPALESVTAAARADDLIASVTEEQPVAEQEEALEAQQDAQRVAVQSAAVQEQEVAQEPAVRADGPAFVSTTDIDTLIRLRAYELFRQRGGIPGYELEDWLRAEREVLQNRR